MVRAFPAWPRALADVDRRLLAGRCAKNPAPNKKGPVAGALWFRNAALSGDAKATSFSLQEPSSQRLSSWLRSSSF
jgi:hypothetical protein